jgi:3-dehydroquinate synthase
MLEAKIDLGSRGAYTIYSGSGFSYLPDILYKDTSYNNEKVFIVTDSNVSKLYLDNLIDILTPRFNVVGSHVINAGEENKNLETVQGIYESLVEHNIDRKSILIALGGGVVGDITGFCAATYLRGVRYVQVPTTLLSQVDSSVGGKTGVDFNGKKNLIGAFYHPELVYMNVDTLKTLDLLQYKSGLGEVLKHSIISTKLPIENKTFFEFLNQNVDSVFDRETNLMINVVNENCLIKAGVVNSDEKETKGMREFLNFGHTIGHAIETDSNFIYPHGICVTMGMVCATFISHNKGLLPESEYKSILGLIKLYGMLPDKNISLNKQGIIDLIKYDKKTINNEARFVLVNKIGSVEINKMVTDDEIIKSIIKLEGVVNNV